jgi:hypothetical protein
LFGIIRRQSAVSLHAERSTLIQFADLEITLNERHIQISDSRRIDPAPVRARVPLAGVSLLLIVALTFSAATASRDAISSEFASHRAPERSALLAHTTVRTAQRVLRRDRVVPAIVRSLVRAERSRMAHTPHRAPGGTTDRLLPAWVLDLPPPHVA